jgi:exodeoxyribonuclease VII small subunit
VVLTGWAVSVRPQPAVPFEHFVSACAEPTEPFVLEHPAQTRWSVAGIKYTHGIDKQRTDSELLENLVDTFVQSDAKLSDTIDGMLAMIDEADKGGASAQLGEFIKIFTERLTKSSCHRAMGTSPESALSYRNAMKELEGIVECLREPAEEIDVDDLFRDVTRAKELIEFCDAKIKYADVQIRDVLKEIRPKSTDGDEQRDDEPKPSPAPPAASRKTPTGSSEVEIPF